MQDEFDRIFQDRKQGLSSTQEAPQTASEAAVEAAGDAAVPAPRRTHIRLHLRSANNTAEPNQTVRAFFILTLYHDLYCYHHDYSLTPLHALRQNALLHQHSVTRHQETSARS